jgi:uncharacterized lipoprotein YajG
LEYDKKKLKSSNKIKTTWEIIHTESGRNIKKCGIQSLNAEGKNTENQLIIAEVFNKYCTTVAEDIHKDIDVNYFINNDDNGTDD